MAHALYTGSHLILITIYETGEETKILRANNFLRIIREPDVELKLEYTVYSAKHSDMPLFWETMFYSSPTRELGLAHLS